MAFLHAEASTVYATQANNIWAGFTYALLPCAAATVVKQHRGVVGTETATGAHCWTHWPQVVTACLATAAVTVHHRFRALRVFLTKRSQMCGVYRTKQQAGRIDAYVPVIYCSYWRACTCTCNALFILTCMYMYLPCTVHMFRTIRPDVGTVGRLGTRTRQYTTSDPRCRSSLALHTSVCTPRTPSTPGRPRKFHYLKCKYVRLYCKNFLQ